LIAWGVFAFLGQLLILHSGQSVPTILSLSLAWMALAGLEARARAPGRMPRGRLQIGADGRVLALGPGGPVRYRLSPGSLLVGGVAWLNIGSAGQGGFSLLIFARDLGPQGWRRLNLLWRHGPKA